jgi:predicted ATPase
MPRVVITGGPGAGKTTLIAELARLGCRTVPESARAIIAERRAAGESPRPDPRAFALEIMRRDIEKCERAANSAEPVFFDRALPEGVAMAREARAVSAEQADRLLAQYTFHRTVFVLPPCEGIYSQDAERDQTFAEAVAVHDKIAYLYRSLGYEQCTVPAASVGQRVQFVLDALAASAA